MTLEQRIKQREIAYRLGIMLVVIGFLTFLSVSILVTTDVDLKWPTEILLISMAVLGYGGLLIVYVSRLGWNKSILIDISLNQMGVLITTFAYVRLSIDFVQDTVKQSGLLSFVIVIIGLLLISLGMKYSTPSS